MLAYKLAKKHYGCLSMSDTDEKCETNPCQSILGSCASLNLRRVSRLVTNEYNEALRPTGLRCTQLAVLAAIGGNDRQSLTDISDLLSMDISTLTRALAILEEKGLVVTRAAGGRKKYVQLTDDGKALIQESEEYWQYAQENFRCRIGDEAWNTLSAILENYLSKEKAA